MMTEQQLTQWMDTYGAEIFRLCYLCLKDYHLAQDAAVIDAMGCTTKYHGFSLGIPSHLSLPRPAPVEGR